MAPQTRFDGFPEDDDEDAPVELSVEKLAALAKQRLRRAQQEVHQLQFEVRNLLAGAEGERTLAEEAKKFLAQWVDAPWHFLFDRKWPGTSDSNIDLIVVGPPGVFVVDVKNWTDAKAERAKLFANGFDCTPKLGGNRAQARDVNRLLTPLGIPAGRVIPVVILAQSLATSKKIANVLVAGMPHFASTLLREPSRYKREEIDDLANLLDRSLPHCIQARFDELESCEMPHDAPAFSTGDLLEAAGTHQERLRWMVRMHPSQADFTTKVFHGPARLSGSAGTGKTVAALHRAHARSQEPGERVLFLSPTKILTQQHEAMLLELGGGRSSVLCSTVPRWCTKFLRNRRIQPEITDGAHLLQRAIHTSKDPTLLSKAGCSPEYLAEEVSHVIKARGITDLPEYLSLERRGRRFPLRETQREAIWTVYEKYEELLSASGKIDWHDVVALTLRQIEMDEKLNRHEAPFSSVIVDEAQDFSLNGMRLIRKLAAESDDGLLLLGDSGQQILPGGYRLVEAGVTIAGSRSLTFSLNYRNGSNIKKRADEVLANTIDESSLNEGSFGHEPGASVCTPGSVAEGSFRSATDQAEALVRFLRSQRPAGWGTMAVLTESWKDLSRWKGVLKRAGIPCALLSETDPRLASDQVVIGTFTKAKGLEFASVAIPMPFPRSVSGPEEAERLLLESQRLYVGISRAVSSLWIGKLDRPNPPVKKSA